MRTLSGDRLASVEEAVAVEGSTSTGASGALSGREHSEKKHCGAKQSAIRASSNKGARRRAVFWLSGWAACSRTMASSATRHTRFMVQVMRT